MLRAGITGNRIYLITDDLSIKSLLEFTHRETRFNPFLKQWRTENVTDKIYLEKKKKDGYWYFEVGLGWAAYIINIFSNNLLVDDKRAIESRIYSDSFRTIPFPCCTICFASVQFITTNYIVRNLISGSSAI